MTILALQQKIFRFQDCVARLFGLDAVQESKERQASRIEGYGKRVSYAADAAMRQERWWNFGLAGSRPARPKGSGGFTLVELLVISPIILDVVLGVVTFLFNEYGNLVQQNGQLNLRVESQNILFSLQDDIWYANLFTSGINSNLSDTYAPQGGWTYNTSPQTLVISTPALTKNHRDPTRTAVYLNESTCIPPDGSGVNSALYDSVIYFASGTNLYKRILTAPANLAICGTPFNKQTCPVAHASPACPADKLMSDHLASFVVTYYDTGNSVVTTPENAESVKVSIGLADKGFGQNITASSSLRLRKINQ